MAVRRHGSERRADLSQHFLRSRALAAKLVAQAGLSRGDLIVEIGAGRGVITTELAKCCSRVHAVELDARLCRELRQLFPDDSRVTVIEADFLRMPLPREPFKVIGNIPFSRTTEIVRRLTEVDPCPTDVFLVVQLEAGQRFCGHPFGPETLASLLIKPWWQVEIVRFLRSDDFEPPPRVSTAVLWLAHRRRGLVHASQRVRYEMFVRNAFGHRGWTMRQCLRKCFTRGQIHRLSRNFGFDPSQPPSTLTFDQWLALFRFSTLDRTVDTS